jgi:hypothetical protein
MISLGRQLAQHRAVLHLRILAYRDHVVIAADHGIEPDARIVLEHRPADDGGVGCDPLVALADDFAVFK